MKFLERFALTIFSVIILVISVFLMCVMLDVVQVDVIIRPMSYILEEIIAYRATLVVTITCILLSIKCLFFRSKKQDLGKEGIVLENSSGKLVISRESLENLVASVARDIPGAEAVSSKTILDKDRNLKVFVTTTVARDIMIKEVSTELQNKIKEAMKASADLEVKEVNIRIKNITSKKVKKVKERVEEATNIEQSITEENVEKEVNSQEGEE